MVTGTPVGKKRFYAGEESGKGKEGRNGGTEGENRTRGGGSGKEKRLEGLAAVVCLGQGQQRRGSRNASVICDGAVVSSSSKRQQQQQQKRNSGVCGRKDAARNGDAREQAKPKRACAGICEVM